MWTGICVCSDESGVSDDRGRRDESGGLTIWGIDKKSQKGSRVRWSDAIYVGITEGWARWFTGIFYVL